MSDIKGTYQETTLLIERLHRQFLEVIKSFLESQKIDDINNVQTLILYNIGDDQLTVGELTHRGYYLGSNVSYNVKKLVEMDYLIQEKAIHDKRSSKVRLSEKGLELRALVDGFYDQSSQNLTERRIAHDKMNNLNQTLIQLEDYWASSIAEMNRVF